MTPTLRIGLLGCGAVGRELVRLFASEAPRLAEAHGVDLRLVAVASRALPRRSELLSTIPPGVRVGEDLSAVALAPDVDLVVELLGGLDPAGPLVESALRAGRSVVTANKLLLATRGAELARLASRTGAALAFEAAVAGGIPILRALRESFVSDRIEEIGGILNGTCNYLLTEMARTGRPYAEVLAEARTLGYAEADPTADVEGADAACKVALLARMAFGADVPLEVVRTEGVTRLRPVDFVYARLLGQVPRQLGLARRLPDGRLLLAVRTALVPASSLLARVDGPLNAVRVTTAHAGEYVLSGPGAGGAPTAAAVLADVVEIARRGAPFLVPPFGTDAPRPCVAGGPADSVAPFYVRFVVDDRPGVLAALTAAFARAEVNVDAVLQVPWTEKRALPFVVTLEPTPEDRVARALDEIASLPFLVEAPLLLPMVS
ncbi:MAG: homoserine dehydrogenase [Thermoanaerobaculia bacterium]|nr:homoserine dehydrogenase [Thermoanaerobaculia bacterium]